jgi:C-terminal processing protease CtpA/Prc
MYDARAFDTFIDGAFESFIAADADTLLIDLRDNPGGDNTFSDYMIAWFADRPFGFASAFRIRVSDEAVASNAARLATAGQNSVSRQLAGVYAAAAIGDVIEFPIPVVAPRRGARFEGRVFVLVNRRSFSNSVLTAAIVQDYQFGRVLGEPTSDLATTYGALERFTLPNSGLSVGFPKAYIVRPSGDARIQGMTPDIAITTPIIQTADDPVLQQALRIIDAEPR